MKNFGTKYAAEAARVRVPPKKSLLPNGHPRPKTYEQVAVESLAVGNANADEQRAASAYVTKLEKVLEALVDAVHPSQHPLRDEAVPAYDAARSILSKKGA